MQQPQHFHTTIPTPDSIRIDTNIDLLSKLFALKTTKHSPFISKIERRACVAIILRIRPKNDPLAMTLPHLNYYHHLHSSYYTDAMQTTSSPHCTTISQTFSLSPSPQLSLFDFSSSTTPLLTDVIPQPLVPHEFYLDSAFPVPPSSPHHPSFTPLNQTKWLSQPWVASGDLEVCFIKRAYNPRDRWSSQMGFPGGRKDKGESDIQTAIREVSEEVGLDISNPRQFAYISRIDDLQIESYKATRQLAVSTFVFLQLTPITPTLYLEPKEVAQILWTPLRLFGIGVNNVPKQISQPSPSTPHLAHHKSLSPPSTSHSTQNNTPHTLLGSYISQYGHNIQTLAVNDHLQTISLSILTQLGSLLHTPLLTTSHSSNSLLPIELSPQLPTSSQSIVNTQSSSLLTQSTVLPTKTNKSNNQTLASAQEIISTNSNSTYNITPQITLPPKIITTKYSQLQTNQLLDMSPASAHHKIQNIWQTNPTRNRTYNLRISSSHLTPSPSSSSPEQTSFLSSIHAASHQSSTQSPPQPQPQYQPTNCLYRTLTLPSRLFTSIFSSLFYSSRSALRHWITPRYQISGMEKIYLKSFQINLPHFYHHRYLPSSYPSSYPSSSSSSSSSSPSSTSSSSTSPSTSSSLLSSSQSTNLCGINIKLSNATEQLLLLGQTTIPFEIVFSPSAAMHRYIWRHRIDTSTPTYPQFLPINSIFSQPPTNQACLHSVLYNIVNNHFHTPSCDELLELLGDVPILPLKEFDHTIYLPRSRDFVHFLSPQHQHQTNLIPSTTTTHVKPITSKPLSPSMIAQLMFQSRLIHYLPNSLLSSQKQQHSPASFNQSFYSPNHIPVQVLHTTSPHTLTLSQPSNPSKSPQPTTGLVNDSPDSTPAFAIEDNAADLAVYADSSSSLEVETTLQGEQMESLIKEDKGKDHHQSMTLQSNQQKSPSPHAQLSGEETQHTHKEISYAKPASSFPISIKFPCLLLPGVGLRTLQHLPPLRPNKTKSPPPTFEQRYQYAIAQQTNQLPFITLGTAETMLWGMTFRNVSNFCTTMNSPLLKTIIDYDNDWRRYVLNLFFRWEEVKGKWFGKGKQKVKIASLSPPSLSLSQPALSVHEDAPAVASAKL